MKKTIFYDEMDNIHFNILKNIYVENMLSMLSCGDYRSAMFHCHYLISCIYLYSKASGYSFEYCYKLFNDFFIKESKKIDNLG